LELCPETDARLPRAANRTATAAEQTTTEAMGLRDNGFTVRGKATGIADPADELSLHNGIRPKRP
jgi:hypothetical protein